MVITKEALVERGFRKYPWDEIYRISKGDMSIVVNYQQKRVLVDPDYGPEIHALGCVTMEQVEELIKLFLA